MSQIEDTAIEYVKARRAKLTAKEKRRALVRACSDENDGAACVYTADVTGDEWCDVCKEATVFHKEYKRLAHKCGVVLRRLEAQVNRAAEE